MKQEIKFNASLIGDPTVEIQYRNGEKPRIVEVVGGILKSVDKTVCSFYHRDNGSIYSYGECPYDLLMFKEQRSDEDIIREYYPDYDTWVDDRDRSQQKALCSAIREDERQKYVQPNELPVNSGKLAEDIAKEVVEDHNINWSVIVDKPFYTALVQAGMDAKSDITVEFYKDKDFHLSGFTFYNNGKQIPADKISLGTYYLTPKKD